MVNDNNDYALNILENSITTQTRINNNLLRVIQAQSWEIEQRRRQQINLEKRIAKLEEQKYPSKQKSQYKGLKVDNRS